jgi:hypothetical protein
MSEKSEVIILPQPREQQQMTVVSKQDVEALKKQRELLREFVQSQLVEAKFGKEDSGEGDFGVIPGTKKRCLFKQGAEKLQRLFQLGCRFKLVDKLIEREANFAMFTYKAEIYSLRNPDVVIAECDGTVNSQEVKYKERTEWKTVGKRKDGSDIRESQKVETPIFDVMNTLMKMAQKRAMIGATLLATGASEYFTQDMLDEDDVPQTTENKAAESKPEEKPQAASGSELCPTCQKKMMLSKYPNRDGERAGKIDYYCLSCKASHPREPQ